MGTDISTQDKSLSRSISSTASRLRDTCSKILNTEIVIGSSEISSNVREELKEKAQDVKKLLSKGRYSSAMTEMLDYPLLTVLREDKEIVDVMKQGMSHAILKCAWMPTTLQESLSTIKKVCLKLRLSKEDVHEILTCKRAVKAFSRSIKYQIKNNNLYIGVGNEVAYMSIFGIEPKVICDTVYDAFKQLGNFAKKHPVRTAMCLKDAWVPEERIFDLIFGGNPQSISAQRRYEVLSSLQKDTDFKRYFTSTEYLYLTKQATNELMKQDIRENLGENISEHLSFIASFDEAERLFFKNEDMYKQILDCIKKQYLSAYDYRKEIREESKFLIKIYGNDAREDLKRIKSEVRGENLFKENARKNNMLSRLFSFWQA